MSSGFGPGFQDTRSKLYRAEYSLISLTIFGYLAWRAVNLGGVDWLQLGFWVIFPDLLAFSGIALSTKRREWPSWGPNLYNSFHTVLLWGIVFAASWFALGTIYWPLFGWLGHITVDRAVGYALRDSTKG
jgi:hypothetical protein